MDDEFTGGSQPAVWEDITNSTQLMFVQDCVSFTTTVSARWVLWGGGGGFDWVFWEGGGFDWVFWGGGKGGLTGCFGRRGGGVEMVLWGGGGRFEKMLWGVKYKWVGGGGG